jgi:hypothetical protein
MEMCVEREEWKRRREWIKLREFWRNGKCWKENWKFGRKLNSENIGGFKIFRVGFGVSLWWEIEKCLKILTIFFSGKKCQKHNMKFGHWFVWRGIMLLFQLYTLILM